MKCARSDDSEPTTLYKEHDGPEHIKDIISHIDGETRKVIFDIKYWSILEGYLMFWDVACRANNPMPLYPQYLDGCKLSPAKTKSVLTCCHIHFDLFKALYNMED